VVRSFCSASAAGWMITPTVTHHWPASQRASPSVSPASQPRPPPTLLASPLPSQTLVVLITVLMYYCASYCCRVSISVVITCCVFTYIASGRLPAWAFSAVERGNAAADTCSVLELTIHSRHCVESTASSRASLKCFVIITGSPARNTSLINAAVHDGSVSGLDHV